MKLFKNKVGRPSNEIKKKRKIFFATICTLFVLVLLVCSILMYKGINNTGALFNGINVTYFDNVAGKEVSRSTNVKLKASFLNIGSKKYYKVIKMPNNIELSSKGIKCRQFRSLGGVSINFKLESSGTYYKTVVYSDSKCTNELESFASKKYYLKSSSVNSSENDATDAITMTRFTAEWKHGSYGTATVKLKDPSDSFTVTSSNSNIMSISNITKTGYKITAVGSGTATITAKSKKTGKSISYTYTVKSYQLPSVSRFGSNSKNIALKGIYNNIPVYVEKSCSTTNVNRFINDIKTLKSYAVKPIKAIYIVKSSSYNIANAKYKSSVGITWSGAYSYIDLKCDTYYPQTVIHEAAHAIDHRYKALTGQTLSSSFNSLYNKYKSVSNRPLRSYSYGDVMEFFADSYARYMGKVSWTFPSDLQSKTKEAINRINSINW